MNKKLKSRHRGAVCSQHTVNIMRVNTIYNTITIIFIAFMIFVISSIIFVTIFSIKKKMAATCLLIYRLFWHSMRVLFLLQWEFFLQWKWPLSLQTTKNLFSQMNSFSRPQSVSVTGTLATALACRRRRCWRRTPTRSSTSRRSSGRWTASPRSRNRRQSLALVASTPCSCPPWLWFWYSFSFTDWP